MKNSKKPNWSGTVSRPEAELLPLLREHLESLQDLCWLYDLGKQHMAAEIAANLRVLFSDSPPKQPSLLRQIKGLERKFLDTGKTMNEGNPNMYTEPVSGMAMRVIREKDQQLVEDWEPHLSIFAGCEPLRTKFGRWWEVPILRTNSGEEYSRRLLVEQTTNQDRGHHVAAKIGRTYFDLTRNADHGHSVHTCERPYGITDPIPAEHFHAVPREDAGQKMVRAILRQVAHEVLLTLLEDPQPYLSSIPPLRPGGNPIAFIQLMASEEPPPLNTFAA